MDSTDASGPMSFGRYGAPRRTIVHLSDTHFLAGNAPLGGRYDTETRLAATLDAVRRIGAPPDAIVVTGDLTDLGEVEAYERLRAAIDPLAAEWGCPVVWVAGNHDERGPLRRGLWGLPETAEPVTGEWDLGGLRLLALDSSVPGWHHGELGDEQLAWLRERLSTPAPLGTILALHHPPIPSHVPLFDILELQDQDAFAEALRGTDVRAILAGHLHYSTSALFAGIPVSVASATCYTMDLANPPERVNGVDAGQGFHLVHVYDDVVTSSVVPTADAATGGFFGPDFYARMAALDPAARRELFSRKRPGA